VANLDPGPIAVRHLPNALTAFRGLCGPLVMAILLGTGRNDLAFATFLLAIVSDLLDGWAARRLQAFNPWAKFVDPLADKLLTDFTWVALAVLGWAPVAFPVVMIGRDLAVGAGFWVHVRRSGALPEPRPLGQISVAFEGTALCVLLFHGPWLSVHWPSVGTALGGIALALSGLDLLDYARPRTRP
jgi:CDP-diacylglycerol--glycerol-3-phosphate 3-phosphatidyltransferase